MRSARLEMALDQDALVLPPAGDILVLRPQAGDDLTALPRDRTVVRTGFLPDHEHFARAGWRVVAPPAPCPPASAALVCLPRARAAAQALIAEALAALPPGAPLLVDGQKTDGIDGLLAACRKAGLQPGPALSKAHGKCFVLTAGTAPTPADWPAQRRLLDGGLQTGPFCFSADGPDRGSALLAAALPDKMPARMADLGAGWGYLAQAVLARPGVTRLDLVEAEAEALDCARAALGGDARAAFHWADATRFRPERAWEGVVMNPPFHTSRTAEPDLGLAFLRAAHAGLAPHGQLWLVANRHLPYAPLLAQLFREVQEIGGDATYRLTRAAHPIRPR